MLSGNGIDINTVHDEAIIQHFEDGVGHRLFALIPNFPFMFVGTILEVADDHVLVDVETTSQAVLENRVWHIHIHSIEVFFIERHDGPQIPKLID
ncbi:hypothetical protein IMZ08_15290 [Bacillus luteolus]|uniref:Uncharacterized protein n=2 Tax=Litchfieldia luteola TaxID=682179 RepID=A0ABR9QLM8_9BACI|nr:hypothetical protein [Cytobacillus luteolus]